MGLLQENEAIFYHPLNDAVEHLQSKTWTGTADTSGSGKVGDAMSRVDISASLGGSSGDYGSAVGATKVAFCGWFQKPSDPPPQTAAPTTAGPIAHAATSCSGTGVNGAVVEVFVDDVSVGSADAAVSEGAWSKTGMAALSADEVVSSRQRSTGELQSAESNEVVVSPAPPSFGAESEFRSDNIQEISVTTLSATKFVVAYRDLNANTGAAKVGTVSGSDVTFGAAADFRAGATVVPNVAALSATSFVVAFRNGQNAYGQARVGTVSGTDITYGAVVDFYSASASYPSVAVLSATKLVVAYTDLSDGKAVVGTVSGADITFGAQAEFSAGSTGTNSAIGLSSTKIVVVYKDQGDSNHGTAKVGTVSGTDVTFGAESEYLSAGAAEYSSAAAISSSQFVVAYQDGADSSHGTAKIGTVSGTDITFGAEAEFNAAITNYIFAAALDTALVPPASATTVAVAYVDQGDSNHGTAKVGTVGGTDIVFGPEGEFHTAGALAYVVAAALDVSKIAVAYQDSSDSNHGTAKIGDL